MGRSKSQSQIQSPGEMEVQDKNTFSKSSSTSQFGQSFQELYAKSCRITLPQADFGTLKTQGPHEQDHATCCWITCLHLRKWPRDNWTLLAALQKQLLWTHQHDWQDPERLHQNWHSILSSQNKHVYTDWLQHWDENRDEMHHQGRCCWIPSSNSALHRDLEPPTVTTPSRITKCYLPSGYIITKCTPSPRD